jgi:phage FluMu gp28-like protein
MREYGRRQGNGKLFKAWIIGPTYDLAMRAWGKFHELIPEEIIASENKERYSIELIDGSIIEWKSADDPERLRGEGLDFVVVDEAAIAPALTWVKIRTRVIDTGGRIMLISTPKGRNWFYDQFCLGQDPARVASGSHESWQFPASMNPHVDSGELGDAVADLDALMVEQELNAVFIDDTGQVFRNIRACAIGEKEPPGTGPYVMGLDLARSTDFTVCCVLDLVQRRVVAWDRFSRLPWPVQIGRVVNLARQYNALIIGDMTGLGEPILDQMREQWGRVQGVVLTNQDRKSVV